jgi:UDP-3-O-[3-hydroxymyristoyl] glucosamine N-acyltransferase
MFVHDKPKIYRIYLILLSKINPLKHAKKIGVRVNKGLRLYGSIGWGSEPWIIDLGEDVILTNHVTFITHDGGYYIFRKEHPDLEITKPISVGNNVFIGVNTIILPGVHIGNNVVIGASSVVTKDIPDNSVAAGNPARVVKSTDEYLKKILAESLHVGNLSPREKDLAMQKIYGFDGNGHKISDQKATVEPKSKS